MEPSYGPNDKSLFGLKGVAELAMLRSILDSEGLTYYVKNEQFTSLRVGPPIDLLNVTHILVKNERRIFRLGGQRAHHGQGSALTDL